MTPPGDATAGRPRQAGPTGPGGPYPPAGPSWRPPVPSSLTTAAKLMNIGGGVCALGAIVGLGTVHELKTIIAQQQPAAPQGTVGAAIAIVLVHGLIGTTLWLWLARETSRGLRRARTWATVIFVIATVTGIGIDANAPSTPLTQAFSGINWVIGLCVVVLLWNRPSRAYYRALHPAGRPAALLTVAQPATPADAAARRGQHAPRLAGPPPGKPIGPAQRIPPVPAGPPRPAPLARPLTVMAGRKPRPSGRGKPGSCVNRVPLLLDVPPDGAQRGTAAGCAEVGRGPEVPVHDVPVHPAGELRSQPSGQAHP